MTDYSRAEAAERAGIGVDELTALVDLGILRPAAVDRFTSGDVRKAELVESLRTAGVSLAGLAEAIERGTVNMDFLDAPVYERFSALSDLTFQQVSDRTGVPIHLLLLIREAAGSAPPSPDDRMRDEELVIADFIEAQAKAGFRPLAVERLIRVYGDSLNRMAQSEAAWWRSEVIEPAMAKGLNAEDMSATDVSTNLSRLGDASVMAMYRAQQTRAWTTNIISGFEQMLAAAGLHSRLERPPAVADALDAAFDPQPDRGSRHRPCLRSKGALYASPRLGAPA